jgi:hypothetical protein
MQKLLILISLILGLAHGGCSTGDDAERVVGKGVASISVLAQALSVEDIDHLTVTVSGPNIDPDIVATIPGDPVGGWAGTIDDIPAGDDRTFWAEAYDAEDALLYSGIASPITILDGDTVFVTIFLQQVDPPVPFDNAVPRFDSLILSDSTVHPDREVDITANASDPNGDPLIYEWNATCGTFSSVNSPSTTWVAPATTGPCLLTVSVTDPPGASATLGFTLDVQTYYGSGTAEVMVDVNTWPVVTGLIPTPTRVDVGESTSLQLTAADPDGDTLTYAWTASCTGSFSDPAAEDPAFTLSADNGNADCILSCAISDSRGGSNTATIAIQTGPGLAVTEGVWTPGNILVAHRLTSGVNVISELAPDGTLIRQFGNETLDIFRTDLVVSGEYLYRNETPYADTLGQFGSDGVRIRSITVGSFTSPVINSMAADFTGDGIFFTDVHAGTNVIRHLDDPATGDQTQFSMVTNSLLDLYHASTLGGDYLYGVCYRYEDTYQLVKVDSAGAVLQYIDSADLTMPYTTDIGAVAVNPITEHVFAATGNKDGDNTCKVIEFLPDGTQVDYFVIDELKPSLDVDDAGNLYIGRYMGDSAGQVSIYTPAGTLVDAIVLPDTTGVVDVLIIR